MEKQHTKVKEKYGLVTAIAMVVGIVMGSGVFFKAEKVLQSTGGNLPLGILAWGIGAAIMLCCAYTFGVMATKYAHVGGAVDYAENVIGKKYAYYLGWFLATMYYPSLTSVLGWISARYFCVLVGLDITGPQCMTIAGFLLMASFCLNVLSPLLAGKFQVATTIIKLVPLLVMAVIGTVVGLSNGMMQENFTMVVTEVASGKALFMAVVATAFAYEGWIIATTINAEIKDSKRNLPRALLIGTFLIAAVYITYYIGLAGTVPNAALMESGEAGAKTAFETLFGPVGGTLTFVFVVISCVGTLNGLMLACCRGFYALAVRKEGPSPKTLSQLDLVTNMPTNASVAGLLACGIWFLYFYGANLADPNWFGFFSFDSSELPIITLYGAYIPIFVLFMKKEKDLPAFQRFVMPLLSLCGAIFMVIAAIVAHGMAVVAYLILFAIVMLFGVWMDKRKKTTRGE